MLKFETIEDLLRKSNLSGHFKKAASFHAAKAAAHEALAKAHTDHATLTKAKGDAMADDHELKSFMVAECALHTAKAAHHTVIAGLHKAHSEHSENQAGALDGDEAKATKVIKEAAGAAAAGASEVKVENNDLNASVGGLMKDTVANAVKELREDPSFKDLFKSAVLEEVKRQLAVKATDGVRGVIPDNPGITLVKRPGGPDPNVDDNVDVPAELAHLIEAD